MLTSLKRVKTYMDKSDTNDDETLYRGILAAQEAVEQFCNRVIEQATYMLEAHDGEGIGYMLVKYPPIASVSYIEVDGVEIDSDDYVVDANVGKIELYNNAKFSEGTKNVKVTYVGGI
jgi:hypothetical protein